MLVTVAGRRSIPSPTQMIFQPMQKRMFRIISVTVLGFAAWLVPARAASADGKENRFLEFPDDTDTLTYDLNTVQMVTPGRFTIVATTIDSPDVMKFKLNALFVLRTYCVRSEGKYQATSELLTLGQPELAVESVNVLVGANKVITWTYPYKRLTPGMPGMVYCKEGSEPEKTEDQLYLESRARITNGSQLKELFDCQRGLWGLFRNENDDPSKVLVGVVKPDTVGALHYSRACYAVLHEAPYQLK